MLDGSPPAPPIRILAISNHRPGSGDRLLTDLDAWWQARASACHGIFMLAAHRVEIQREHCNSRGRIVTSLRNLSVVHDRAEHSGSNGLQATHGLQDGALTDIPCVQDE